MIPKPAQYLLRFDDLCPTFSISQWQRFVPLLDEFHIQPVLAVVPDNRDPELMVADSDAEFWERMRRLERKGATIALHGWHHQCRNRGRSLLPFDALTEFAGQDEEDQFEWIRKGLEALVSQGLRPRLWVAPRHGFDAATLRALKRAGIVYLSDGLTRVPFLRGEVTWIPQQLWGPEEHSRGLWTICIHSNSATDRSVEQLRAFLGSHASQFTSFERVLREYRPGNLNLWEKISAAFRMRRILARRHQKASGSRGKASESADARSLGPNASDIDSA